MKGLLFGLVTAAALASPMGAQPRADTLFVEVGSSSVDGRVFKPHAARVKIYRSDSLVAQWVNELQLGDSAGLQVMRWTTTSERVPLFPNRPLSVLRQTYDAQTMAPLGFSSMSNTGAWTSLAITGRRVQGKRKTANDTTIHSVDHELDRPGFFAGASDLVPVAAGLRSGSVIVAPLWSANARSAEYRVFAVMRDTTLMVEGQPVVARKVEERRRDDGSLYANWYLLAQDPYMVYGEVPLPDGRVQRMTEVPVR